VWTEQTIAGMVPIGGTSAADNIQGYPRADVINGGAGNDTIHGAGGNDTIDGGTGSDWLYGENGNDTLRAGTGDPKNATLSNHLFGGNGNDVLVSSGKTDTLEGEAGYDLDIGAGGAEFLTEIGYDGSSNLMFGAAGADSIRMYGGGKGLAIGGSGNDNVNGGLGSGVVNSRLVVSYNKTDGADSVGLLGAGSMLSIGGGATYSNLGLEAQGLNLKLKLSSQNYIMLTGWYSTAPWDGKNVSTLQIVIEGTTNYNPSSSNPMNNRKIQAFDFLGLAAAFDAAGQPSNFNVANNLPNFRLWGSDTDAFGGAVAYQYARTGNLGTLTYSQMQAVINDPAFGVSAQSITPVAAMSGEAPATSETSSELVAESFLAVSDAGAIESLPVTLPDTALEHPPVLLERLVPQAPELVASPTPQFLPDAPGAAGAASMRASQPASGAASSAAAQPPKANGSQAPFAGDQSLTPATAAETESPQRDKPDVGAQQAGASAQDESDALVAQWFDRSSRDDDLSLLDDILRGDTGVGTASPGAIAAQWERSHQWLSRYAQARTGAGETGADGAHLSGLSYLGIDEGGFDMPRAMVGLRGVAGHELKAFSGLQEGLKVLGRT
jgi:hypothetical protein